MTQWPLSQENVPTSQEIFEGLLDTLTPKLGETFPLFISSQGSFPSQLLNELPSQNESLPTSTDSRNHSNQLPPSSDDPFSQSCHASCSSFNKNNNYTTTNSQSQLKRKQEDFPELPFRLKSKSTVSTNNVENGLNRIHDSTHRLQPIDEHIKDDEQVKQMQFLGISKKGSGTLTLHPIRTNPPTKRLRTSSVSSSNYTSSTVYDSDETVSPGKCNFNLIISLTNVSPIR